MTPKQQRFVQEYLIDLNATQAYMRAGYKGNEATAAVEGHKLLRNPKIAAAIKAAQDERAKRTEITLDRITKMLEEDRDLARKNDQTGAAVTATMGLAKIHGHIVDKQKLDITMPPAEDLTDDELTHIAHRAPGSRNGTAKKANGSAKPDSVH